MELFSELWVKFGLEKEENQGQQGNKSVDRNQELALIICELGSIFVVKDGCDDEVLEVENREVKHALSHQVFDQVGRKEDELLGFYQFEFEWHQN